MSEAEARHILIFICKFCNACNGINKLFLNQQKRLAHCDNICVIANIAARCAEMDNRLCVRAKVAVSVNMAHNIVAELLFIFLRRLVINIICVSFKLFYLFLGYIKTELVLCLCKSNPKLSPCFKFKIGRIDILHFLACIASIERRIICVIRHIIQVPSFSSFRHKRLQLRRGRGGSGPYRAFREY